MKLNLGCGDDVRLGYVNIDMVPKTQDVRRGDFKKLSVSGINENSCEEILAIDVIEFVKITDIGACLEGWAKVLSSNGTLYIESLDYSYFGNLLAYEQVPIEHINQILFGSAMPLQGIYSLATVESFLNQLGLNTVQKGFKDFKFYLQVRKS